MKKYIKKNRNMYKILLEIKYLYMIQKERIKNLYYKLKIKKIDYQNYKKTRQAKGIVYTCIVGEYDTLKTHKYINYDWDYVCYTNNKRIVSDGIWEIRELRFDKLDSSRNNRWHKLAPHELFPDKEMSLYIDGNIRILSRDFFKLINEDECFISAKHPQRDCLYEEAEECKVLKLEKEEIINNQLKQITEEKFPQKYGLYEANILYRKHNEEKIIKMDEEWWEFVSKQAKRDQLSLTYVCWKNNIPFRTFLDTSFRIKNKYIEITPHLIRRK